MFVDKVRPIMDEELMKWKSSSTFQCSKVSSNLYAKKRKAVGIEIMKRGRKNKQPARTVEHDTDQKSDDDSTITYKTTYDNSVAIDVVIVDVYHWI